MEKSKLEVLIESVMDRTVSIEQVWKTYGNQILSVSKTKSEGEAIALAALYFAMVITLRTKGICKTRKNITLTVSLCSRERKT